MNVHDNGTFMYAKHGKLVKLLNLLTRTHLAQS